MTSYGQRSCPLRSLASRTDHAAAQGRGAVTGIAMDGVPDVGQDARGSIDVAWWPIIEAMSQLHAALGAVVLGTSALLALAAFGTNILDRSPRWLDGLRLLIAGLAVAGAASGLALAMNGPGPSEAIHWLYGVVIVALPVIAASIDVGESARVRSTAFGVAGVLMALIAWRLASSG